MTRELYDGAELRPYTGRVGAMDAFKLKSINGSRSMFEYSRRTREDVIEHQAEVKESKEDPCS